MARPGCRAAPSKGPLGRGLRPVIFELTPQYHLGAGAASVLFRASAVWPSSALLRLHDVPERLPDRLDPAAVDAEVPVPLPRCRADVDHPGRPVDPEFHVVHESQQRPELGPDTDPRSGDERGAGQGAYDRFESFPGFLRRPPERNRVNPSGRVGVAARHAIGGRGAGGRGEPPAAEANRGTPTGGGGSGTSAFPYLTMHPCGHPTGTFAPPGCDGAGV